MTDGVCARRREERLAPARAWEEAGGVEARQPMTRFPNSTGVGGLRKQAVALSAVVGACRGEARS